MKIRNGFVSNSSSSSFVLKPLTDEGNLIISNIAGVKSEPPLSEKNYNYISIELKILKNKVDSFIKNKTARDYSLLYNVISKIKDRVLGNPSYICSELSQTILAFSNYLEKLKVNDKDIFKKVSAAYKKLDKYVEDLKKNSPKEEKDKYLTYKVSVDSTWGNSKDCILALEKMGLIKIISKTET